ncbi:transposable element Tcb1 transposase [Trichonephila clavipes]|nr:transposable element Tcb1 transposase [Trichonephila clavipes]
MLYSDASGVEHTYSGPHNSGNKSDESTFTLFQTTGRVYVWRTPKEAFAPECIVSTVKHGGVSLMVWGAISWRGLGPLVTLHGKVKAAHYVSILGDQMHPFV